MSKTLAEKIAVMQAAERGAEIESRPRTTATAWMSNPAPSWQWQSIDFRVKPQPKVIWVNEYSDHSVAHRTEDEARNAAGDGVIHTAVKYVEAQD